MNVWELIINAGPVVKFVMFTLFMFSVFSWGIIIYKYRIIKQSSIESDKFLDAFWKSNSLDTIFTESKTFSYSPISKVFQAGYQELKKLAEFQLKDHKQVENKPKNFSLELDGFDNVERTLKKATFTEITNLETRVPFLATTASTAPFIGLFGTVWGIMNSFHEIGAQGAANLAVVAPGISEALIATAVGLAAAIPAAVFYNYFSSKIRFIASEIDNFSSDFLNIVQRNFFRT